MRGSIDVKDETEIPARPSKFIVAAAAILLAGAVGVGALAFRAIPQEVPDLRAPTAALAAARASAAAQAISQKVASVRLMLEALAEKGGAGLAGAMPLDSPFAPSRKLMAWSNWLPIALTARPDGRCDRRVAGP